MTGPPTGASSAALFESRALAELSAADALCPGSDVVAWRGSLLAGVALVKGMPGPAEAAGGAALSGPDGTAALKALEALGWDAAEVFFTLSRPVSGCDDDRRAARLRAQIEAVDPLVIVALDRAAADDLGRAFDRPPIEPGGTTYAIGRRLVAVGEFERSLADEALKRAAWIQFQAARPPGPVY